MRGSIVVYGKTRQPECSSVAEGFTALGADVSFAGLSNFSEADYDSSADLVVTFGQRLWSAKVAEVYRARGVPVITIDLPPIREPGHEGMIRSDNYRSLWLDRVNWMPGESLPAHRLAAMGVKLGVREPGHRILVCGQKGGDAAHEMSRKQVERWAHATCALARQFDKVTWRPHPHEVFRVKGVPMSHPGSTRLTAELPLPWRALVTYNSTCGIEAIIRGIPVVCSPSSFYAELCSTSLAELDNPKRPTVQERVAFLSRLAYTQWTWDEIASGEALSFILGQIDKAKAA